MYVFVTTISLQFTITFTTGFCSSITAGSSLNYAELIGTIGASSFLIIMTKVALNRGTKFNNPLNGQVQQSTQWHSHLAIGKGLPSCMLYHWFIGHWGFLFQWGLPIAIFCISCYMWLTFSLLAFTIHIFAAYLISSWASHACCFSLLHVVICCISAVIIFRARAFQCTFSGHRFL